MSRWRRISATALEVLEAERPIDLLITDIVMPGSVNGIALSRMARLRRRDLKVVYLTGYNVPGVENEGLRADPAEADRRCRAGQRNRTDDGNRLGLPRRAETPSYGRLPETTL